VEFAFIRAEKARLPTAKLCRALGVSRSGYYAWTRRPPSARALVDAKLVPAIRACHSSTRSAYCQRDGTIFHPRQQTIVRREMRCAFGWVP
jgi:hypothetical protein